MKFIRKVGKGLKTFMEEKVEVCKEILSSAQNRAILGTIVIGGGIGVIAIGVCLVISSRIHIPV